MMTKEFNLTGLEETFDKACKSFLVKMIYDQTGEKARSHISKLEFWGVNLRSQSIQDWERRISEFSESHETEIPQEVWTFI